MKLFNIKEIELPKYTKGEELLNTVTHVIGAMIAVVILVTGLITVSRHQKEYSLLSCWIYGLSMIILYVVSSVYHGLPPGDDKRIMRIVDHCTIYLLIAGSYTPILLTGIRPAHPTLAWTLFAAEWGLGLLAACLTAMDLKRSSRLSMFCYIAMGWLVVFALKPTIEAITASGFAWLLAGGICYTLGAVLYKLGKRRRYFHAVFHVFTVFASVLQAVCILKYVL